MSRRAMRGWLFLAFLLTLPVPYVVGAIGFAPVARILFVAGMISTAWLAEGGTTVGTLAAITWVQTGVFSGLLFGLAALGARLLERVLPTPRRTPAVLAVVILLLGWSLFDVYDTPLSSAGARTNLLELHR